MRHDQPGQISQGRGVTGSISASFSKIKEGKNKVLYPYEFL